MNKKFTLDELLENSEGTIDFFVENNLIHECDCEYTVYDYEQVDELVQHMFGDERCDEIHYWACNLSNNYGWLDLEDSDEENGLYFCQYCVDSEHKYENKIIFVDESGNTGSKFYDIQQPYYVEAGWILSEDILDEARQIILELEKENFYTSKTKGSSLKKNRRGLLYCNKVFKSLGKIGAIPFFYVIEKRYAVCAKIVETFLDSAYNSNVNVKELSDPKQRQGDAQKFYDGPEELIIEFADAYRNSNEILFKDNVHKWIEYFKNVDEKFSEKINGCLNQIDEIIEIEQTGKDDVPVGFDSLNMPSMAQVIQHVEQEIPFSTKIIHDEIATFEEVYLYVFNMYMNATPCQIILRDNRKLVLGLKNLKSLEFENSETEPLLRAADYLASTSTEYAKCVMSDKEYMIELAECAFTSFGCILFGVFGHMLNEPTPKLGEIFGSEQFQEKVLSKLSMDMPKMNLNS